jgi:hypothetical protein
MRHLLTNSEVPLGNKRANLKLESEFQNVAIPFFYISESPTQKHFWDVCTFVET